MNTETPSGNTPSIREYSKNVLANTNIFIIGCGLLIFLIFLYFFLNQFIFMWKENDLPDTVCISLAEQRVTGTTSAFLVALDSHGSYYKDERCVYQNEHWVLRGADVNTITSLGSSYAKDKNRVYIGSSASNLYDPSSFEVIDETLGVLKDKRGIYVKESLVENVDPVSFTRIGYTCKHGSYWKDAKRVFYIDLENGYTKLEGADPNTFAIAGNLAKDKNGVYACDHFIQDPYPDSLVQVDPIFENEYRGATDYARTNTKVFWKTTFIETLDATTFNYRGYGYATDKAHVYHDGTMLPTFDVASFHVMSKDFSRDKNSVYVVRDATPQILAGADPKEFRLLNESLGMDSKNIYNPSTGLPFDTTYKLTRLDLPSLVHVYAYTVYKDKNGVYVHNTPGPNEERAEADLIPITDAHSATFEYIGGCETGYAWGASYYRDAYRIYVIDSNSGKVTYPDVDRETFEYLGQGKLEPYEGKVELAKDKNNVYRSCGIKLEGINPNTFKFVK